MSHDTYEAAKRRILGGEDRPYTLAEAEALHARVCELEGIRRDHEAIRRIDDSTIEVQRKTIAVQGKTVAALMDAIKTTGQSMRDLADRMEREDRDRADRERAAAALRAEQNDLLARTPLAERQAVIEAYRARHAAIWGRR